MKSCEVCGMKIPMAENDWPKRYAEKRFCSRSCANRSRGINPVTTRYAYRKAGIPEHRAVMAESLGRPLLQGEVVHHKNGNKLDNRIENLQLTNAREHGLGHFTPKNPVSKTCPVCGASFTPHKSHRKTTKTCGRACGARLAAAR